MGHRNIQFTGHMIDLEADQGQSQRHPEPSFFYANVSNFPQPNLQPVVSGPRNQCNYHFHPISEHHDNAVFYGMTRYNDVHPQYPAPNLEPSAHYNPYLAPPPGVRDIPVQVNHGAHNQISLPMTQRIVGIPTDSYHRNIPCLDGFRESFKRKNAEGASGYQYQNASVGPSSSVVPMTDRPAESDIAQENAAALQNGSLRSVRNTAGMVGPQSVPAHNASHVIQGNYVAPPVQLPGNPWFDMNYGASSWTQPPNLPYVHASTNGACVEAGNIGVQGYQATGINRSAAGFLHPPFAQGHHPNRHLPPQPMQVMSVNHPSQMAASSHRIPTNSGISHFHDVLDAPPSTFPAGAPPTGFRLYRPHRREIMHDLNARYHSLPPLRVLPEDEVAMLEIPGYHEIGDSIDQHRDMRLDIDHMSYEELLALGEQIGSVGTGLSDDFIQNNLEIRTFTSSPACTNLEAASDQKTINFCVVCQMDYKNEEHIGRLECGHEYHQDCIKKWLLVKNACPVCKSPALTPKAKDS